MSGKGEKHDAKRQRTEEGDGGGPAAADGSTAAELAAHSASEAAAQVAPGASASVAPAPGAAPDLLEAGVDSEDDEVGGEEFHEEELIEPLESIYVRKAPNGSYVVIRVGDERWECDEHDASNVLQRPGPAITYGVAITALDILIEAGKKMNLASPDLPVLPDGKQYLPRVDPVNKRVFGAFAVSVDDYIGIIHAAEQGKIYLQKNTGA